jgi:hypothetical protein
VTLDLSLIWLSGVKLFGKNPRFWLRKSSMKVTVNPITNRPFFCDYSHFYRTVISFSKSAKIPVGMSCGGFGTFVGPNPKSVGHWMTGGG